MIPWLAALLIVAVGRPVVVLADADEMSLGGELSAGLATVGDRAVRGETDTDLRLGTAVRASYATSDWYAYEVGFAWERLARYAEYSLAPERATRIRTWGWWRLEGGVAVRLGVAWIPTLRAALGVQRRSGEAVVRRVAWTESVDGAPELEVIASLGTGLEHRLGQIWVIGARLDGQRSFLVGESIYRAVSAALYVKGYWYP